MRSGFRVAGTGNIQKDRFEAGLRTALRLRVELRAATALFAWQNKIEYQVDAIFGSVIVNGMHTPIIDLKYLAFSHVDSLFANGKSDLIIGDDWQMDTMRMGQRKVLVLMFCNTTASAESHQ